MRRITQLLAVLAATLAAAGPAAARSARLEVRSERTGSRHAGVVVVNRQVAARVLTANGDLGPVDRARLAVERLQAALDKGLGARHVRALADGRRWVVAIGDQTLLYATRLEARHHRSSPAGLAGRWAASFRRLLALPPVALSHRVIVIPLGEKRALAVTGYARDWERVEAVDSEEVAGAQLVGGRLVLTARRPGRTTATVSADGHTARCEVIVRKRAGRLALLSDAEVTGSPAPPDLSSAAATVAVRRFLDVEPGASVRIVSAPRVARSLRADQAVVVRALVEISGAGYLPVRGEVSVRVRNREVAFRSMAHLLYSNVPERIRKPGTLYIGHLDSSGPVRLFYHHVNNMAQPVALSVSLVNTGPDPVTLQIVPGFAAPDLDAVQAGRKAGQSFFPRMLRNAGEIYTLPGRSTVPLAVHRLAVEETGSGIADVRLLEPAGGRCALRVSAEPWSASGWPRLAADHLDAWRHVLPRPASAAELADSEPSDYVFPGPTKTVHAEYTIGKPWTWIRLGDGPIQGVRGNLRLDGNYGVLYRINVKVHNPTETRRTVEVAFEAGAGPASGLFNIGGRLVDVPSAYPREERSLARFDVEPGAVRTIQIETVPLGGSAYPAALIVR